MSLIVMPAAFIPATIPGAEKVALGSSLPAVKASPSVPVVQSAGVLQIDGTMVERGIVARRDALIAVEPTGVEPTGVEPTGVEPTGVEPTGAEARSPATSIWSTVVSAVAPRQLPPLLGIKP